MAKVRVRKAVLAEDPTVCDVAKLSKYTKDFATLNYIREEIQNLYLKGFVGVATSGSKLCGFVYVRHLVLKSRPVSVIHYLGVCPDTTGKGVGRALVEWALNTSPHGVVQLGVEERNTEAVAFYDKLGFSRIGLTAVGPKNRPRPYIKMELRKHVPETV
jgi:ribosomal protein S18 acetylase RimI-like enzyme